LWTTQAYQSAPAFRYTEVSIRVAQAVYSEQVPGGEGGERERVAIGHDVRGGAADMEKRRKEIAERWMELQSETDEMAEQQKQMLDGLYRAAAAAAALAHSAGARSVTTR
jgi:hypothetical protein